MATTPAIPPAYWPNTDGKAEPEVSRALRLVYDSLNDHNNAISELKSQVDLKNGVTPVTPPVTPPATGGGGTSPNTNLHPINLQSSDYTLQNGDNNGLVSMNSAAATTITLNAAMTIGSMVTLENINTGPVAITPSSGTINGQTSISLAQNQGCIVFFDGTNWWGLTTPNPVTFQTNGALNGSQVLLNLIAGSNITLADNGSGGVTITATGSGSAPTITTNANGTAVAFAGGYVHQFGASAASPTGVAKSTVAVTFPITFGGIPRVVCNVDNNADSFGTSVFSCYPSSITANGFTANFACGVIIGGSGAGNITNVVHANWEADFA